MLYGNVIVGQSGGPTAAINASLAGVIRGTIENWSIGTVYGAVSYTHLSEEKTDSSEEDSDGTDDTDKGNAPAIDFRKFFAPLTNLGVQKNSDSEKTDGTKEKSGTSGEKKKQKRKYLNMYCSNLTGLAKEGKLDRVIGREREIARTVQILCRRQKNNPCLIGEPGVGKTA